ncbi:EAL domain-containing protein [Novosphingobium pokkalii]|uniref:EAL domain-containing protein n=2 Tax=Novosphingobium pokkalii TaxID=1770194 RepID=A0ABV7UY78_9SPHN|nr:hypothetical protein GCM10019060_27490 [Novosphingobium pokkalii]
MADRLFRAPRAFATPFMDSDDAVLLFAVRIDNFDVICACYGAPFAATVAASVRSFFECRFDEADGFIGGVVRRGVAEFDLVARGSAERGLSDIQPEYAQISTWLVACARLPVCVDGASVHVSLSWGCVETDPDYGDEEVLDLLLHEARGRIPGRAQLPPTCSDVPDLAARDMAAAAAFYAELNAGELQFAWQPVRSLDSDAILFLRARIAAPGRRGQIEARELPYRSLERAGVVQAFDQALLCEAVEHLAHSDAPAVCVAISALSFRASGWWDGLLARLAQDRLLAVRLFIAIDCAQSFVVTGEAVAFADRLRRLGCRVVLEGLGSGQVAIATMMALRPDVVMLDALFLRLSARREPDEQLFCRTVSLAGSLAPVVVADGVGDRELATLALDSGVHWGAGDFLGEPSWRGHARAGERSARISSFAPFIDPRQRSGGGQ